jgi:hypothetical protein
MKIAQPHDSPRIYEEMPEHLASVKDYSSLDVTLYEKLSLALDLDDGERLVFRLLFFNPGVYVSESELLFLTCGLFATEAGGAELAQRVARIKRKCVETLGADLIESHPDHGHMASPRLVAAMPTAAGHDLVIPLDGAP